MTEQIPRGLAPYCDSHDELDQNLDATLATLTRMGAKVTLPISEGLPYSLPSGELHVPRVDPSRLARICDRMRAIGVFPVFFSFPAIDGDLAESVRYFLECRAATKAPGQWDIEPKNRETRWTDELLAPLLAADPEASITSTRAQLPSLSLPGRRIWLQAERKGSTDHLDADLARWPDAVVVTGDFSLAGDARSIDDVVRDNARCAAQARRVGNHAVWSVHSTTHQEADVYREWSIATFG